MPAVAPVRLTEVALKLPKFCQVGAPDTRILTLYVDAPETAFQLIVAVVCVMFVVESPVGALHGGALTVNEWLVVTPRYVTSNFQVPDGAFVGKT